MEIMRYKGDGCNRKLFILITQSKIMITQPDGKIVETKDDCIYVHSPNGTTTKHSAKDLAILTEVPHDNFGQPKRDDSYDLAKIKERAELEMITNCPVGDQWSPERPLSKRK
jgi:hypothetical protein